MSLILVSYLWRTFLIRTSGVLFLLATVYMSIDLVETGARVSASTTQIFAAYVYKIPLVVSHVLPLALTLGALLTLSLFRRRGEWTAMLVSGMSPFIPVAAIAAILTLFTGFAYFLVHTAAPAGMSRFENSTGQSNFSGSNLYLDGTSIVSRQPNEKGEVSIVLQRDAGRTKSLRVAEEESDKLLASWDRNEGWKSVSGQESGGIPDRINVITPGANGLLGGGESTGKLREHLVALKKGGLCSRGVAAQIGLRNALVVSCFIVPLLALFIAGVLATQKSSASVILGIAICALYWALLVAAWTGATIGVLPVWSVMGGVTGVWAVLLLAGGLAFATRPLPY